VLNIISPLDPLKPALDVRRSKLPLEDFEPYPVVKDIWPPVEDVDSPDDMTTLPPFPLSPEPTETSIDPPKPDDADPDPIFKTPLLPD
jgi:hypothetical protein